MKPVLKIAHYEVLHIFKDPILFIVVFIAPLFYVTLFGIVYFSGVLNDIPLAVVNQDNSQLSREVVTAFRNDSHFKIVEGIRTYSQLELGMRDGTVRAGVVIPEDFAGDIIEHRHTEVLTVYDASNLIWGYNIRKNALEVVNQFNASYTAAYLAGSAPTLNKHEIENVMDTVSCTTSIWYNPTFNYVDFLFMGLMMMVIHQIGFLGIALTVTREKEKRSWIQYLTCSLPGWKITAGKCLPYLISIFFNYSLLIWISTQFVHAKIEGSVGLIILLGLFYTLIIVGVGYFVSVQASNSLQVTRYLMLLSVPFFLISGYTWPSTHIPAVLNGIARLLPFTWMAEGFRLVTIKNLAIADIVPTILVLGTMAVLSIGLALTFNKQSQSPDDNTLLVNCGNTYPRRSRR